MDKRNKLASTLSGGMQRRLNLALGLVHDPEILVLDEPEAGLDPQSRILVREYTRSLARKKTIILTTHNMDEADRMADRVAIIDHGKLLVLDTPEALKRTVGEGDVLEMEVKEIATEKALTSLQTKVLNVTTMAGKIVVRAKNIVDKLPAIIETIQNAGGQVGEVHLRENTLEDVFISLTGRKLRE
jgi:ABC-2 type transport system ATP-binding protein